MSKIQLNKNQKEVLFIVALFLVPFLDPGFALLLGLILSLTIGHPFLAINSRITHILLQISVVGLGFGMNVEEVPLPPWLLSLKPKTRTSPWPWEPFSCLTPWHYLSSR